jgi:hypothetical protein
VGAQASIGKARLVRRDLKFLKRCEAIYLFGPPEIPPQTDACGHRYVRGLCQTVAEQEALREAPEIIGVSGRLWSFWNVLVGGDGGIRIRPFFRGIGHF